MNAKSFLSKALDAALAGPSAKATTAPATPTESRAAAIRSQAAKAAGNAIGQRPGNGTPEIFALIANAPAVQKVATPEPFTTLRAIKKQQDEIHAETSRVASEGHESRVLRHIDAAARKLISGSKYEGFPHQGNAKEAELSILKAALTILSQQAAPLVRPIRQAAALEAERLLEIEIKFEVERAEKFGTPMSEPSQTIANLAAAAALLKTYAASTKLPTSYAPVSGMLEPLFTLEK